MAYRDGYLYAGTENGVFKIDVTKGKSSWTTVGVTALSRVIYALCFIDNVLYFGTDSGVFKVDTTDADANWLPVSPVTLANIVYTLYQ